LSPSFPFFKKGESVALVFPAESRPKRRSPLRVLPYLLLRLPLWRWLRALPAAVFDAFEVRPSRSTFDAALAAFLPVVLRCAT
jgi:hypothetical protein